MTKQTLARGPLLVRRPVADTAAFRDSMDRFMSESLWGTPFRTLWASTGNGTGSQTAHRPLPLDVYATPDNVVLIAAVPGLGAADVEITYDQGVVSIAGQLPNVAASEEGQGATWYRHELPHGTVRRSVRLPCEVNVNAAEVTFADGILRLTLPKAEPARPKQIKVRGV